MKLHSKSIIILSMLFLIIAGCSKDEESKQPETKNIEKPKQHVNESKEIETKIFALLEAKKKFKNVVLDAEGFTTDGKAVEPPKDLFKIIHFDSEVGKLVAYITLKPKEDVKLPAIIWIHGGFGGIGGWFWEEDSYIQPFLNGECVVMCPSRRGENDNPGKFDFGYGEVNDTVSAIEYVSKLDYVDKSRIYLLGHSTGGTNVLLAALCTDKVRAAFSYGGVTDMTELAEAWDEVGLTPFDYTSEQEINLRSSVKFVDTLKTPTFYFEGQENNYYIYLAREAEKIAKNANTPFKVFSVYRGDHFTIVSPTNELIWRKIKKDTGEKTNIDFTPEEVNINFRKAMEALEND